MRIQPIDRRALCHTIRWSPKRLLEKGHDEDRHIIDKVRISENMTLSYRKTGVQMTREANWCVWWDAHWSGKVDGKMPEFAIGDTIEFMANYAPVYPQVSTIIAIVPHWDQDGKVHHLQIMLR